jgi:hypothetical protein
MLAMQIGVHEGMHLKLSGYASNLTYVGRRAVLILFINGRPVEQGQLKRAMEAMYVAQVSSGGPRRYAGCGYIMQCHQKAGLEMGVLALRAVAREAVVEGRAMHYRMLTDKLTGTLHCFTHLGGFRGKA